MALKEWWHYFWRGAIYIYLAPPRRIPLMEIYKRAEKFGFDFYGGSLDILWFNERLRESAVSGELVFWGRPNIAKIPHFVVLDIQKPIPADHWKTYELDWLQHTNMREGNLAGDIMSFKDENIYYASHVAINHSARLPSFKGSSDGAFFDLHVYAAHASAWLNNVAVPPYRRKEC